MKIKDLIRPNVLNMKPYSSARDESIGGTIMLDANENPYSNGLNRYPDPYQSELKAKISGIWAASEKNLVLGNGSDELIDLLIRAFCEPGVDNVVGLRPSYGMYSVCCAINNVEYREADLDANFDLNASQLLDATDANTKLIFLCSPNNPTGNCFNQKEVQLLLDQFQGLVVIDEAYIDFSDKRSWINSLTKHPQLVVLQTLSKAFSMASLRIGLAWCGEEIVAVLNKIKPPYNINLLGQQTAIQRLDEIDKSMAKIERIKASRELMTKSLRNLSFVRKVFPSETNFILVEVENADDLFEFLLRNGIVVRNRSTQFNCDNCLRISIGTEEENTILLEILTIYQDEKSIVYR